MEVIRKSVISSGAEIPLLAEVAQAAQSLVQQSYANTDEMYLFPQATTKNAPIIVYPESAMAFPTTNI
jgi:hypothetical protein